jgi:flagellin
LTGGDFFELRDLVTVACRLFVILRGRRVFHAADEGVQTITVSIMRDAAGVLTMGTATVTNVVLAGMAAAITTASTPDAVDTLIDSANSAAAAFGAAQARIEAQNVFLTKQADALKSGVGALVDADMEEASARLSALQVQQQLGIQALSIANQQPQSLLALFR